MLSALSWKGKGMKNLSTKCILSEIVSYRWEKSTLCKLIKIQRENKPPANMLQDAKNIKLIK